LEVKVKVEPRRIRKQTEHYNPLEENKKPQQKQSTKTPTKKETGKTRPVAPKTLEVKVKVEPSRRRKQTEHYNPLEENKKTQQKQSSTKTPTKKATGKTRPVAPKALEVKVKVEPRRIRKQTEHYNPLEENKKPQQKQSTKTPTKKETGKTRPVAPKTLEVKVKVEPLILKPVSKELLCDHCNFGGELMQCHHPLMGGVHEMGCGKVVHSFCVGREEIPKGSWMCTTCSVDHGYKVKVPKELRNKNIPDYGYEFSEESDVHIWEQQLEKALAEWKRNKRTSSADKSLLQPKNLSDSLFDDEDIKDEDEDDDEDSCAHHVGPCDICKADGELMRCRSQLTGIGCGKGVHMYCVFREEMPEGDWVCEDCARDNSLKLDKKYPAMGYEYPLADVVGSIPKGEDTFEWSEGLGYRIQVGSRIGVYDSEDDEYENGTLEYKDVVRGVFHLVFDDGDRRTVNMRNRRLRLLSEKETTYEDLKMKMRLSLDPSLPNYIICGGGVTKAHNRKHAHRLLEHYVEVLLDDDITASLKRGESDNYVMCQEVLEKLKHDDIEFIQWDATIGGFGKASKKEIKKKITSTFEEKREERALMPRGQVQPPPIIPQDDGPILHMLLVNGGRPFLKIPRKHVSDDPFLVLERLHERRRRYNARESGIISMQCFSAPSDESKMTDSASALDKLLDKLPKKEVAPSVWDSDIFDDAQEDKSPERKTTKSPRHSIPQRMFQHNRKETMPEVIAKSRGKQLPPPPTQSVPAKKKRGRAPPAKNLKQAPPSKKLKAAPTYAAPAYTNSTNRIVRMNSHHFDKWDIQLRRAARFRKKHGHCNIPSAYPDDPSLATWAKRQRHQYQLYLREADRCTMTPERIAALASIDFCFDNQQIKWLQRFEELKAYSEKYGNTRVSTVMKGHQQLGAWVKHQRAQKKQYDVGVTTFITQNRIDMLNSIGFIWQARGLKDVEGVPKKSTKLARNSTLI